MNARRRVAVVAAVLLASAGMAVPAAGADVPDGPELVSANHAGDPSFEDTANGQVSDDGNRVLFVQQSYDDVPDVVRLRDRAAGTTESVLGGDQPDDVYTAALSGNGRYAAVNVHVVDLDQFTLTVYGLDDNSVRHVGDYTYTGSPSLSDNGRVIAFAGRKAGQRLSAVFVHNLSTGATTRMTVPSAAATDPVISGDGTRVAFRQYGHVYVRSVATGATTRIDVRADGTFGTKGGAKPVAISDNGAFVAFTTRATDLATGTEACAEPPSGCLFRRNLGMRRTTVASVLPSGEIAPLVDRADMSGDGRVVAFGALISSPGGGDTSAIYVRVLGTATTRLASVNAAGEPADGPSHDPRLTDDGALVTFSSSASNFGHDVPNAQYWIARGK